MSQEQNTKDETTYQLPKYLEDLMALYGITDESMDDIEKREKEEEEKALEKWHELVEAIQQERK